MASLQPYRSGGKRYYRLVESYRDENSRPKIRLLRHLGTADNLLRMLTEGPGRALYAETREFGAVAALWDIAAEIDLVGTIDRHVEKRDQGATVGQYMLLATVNRTVAPTSKRRLASWYSGTILARLLSLRRGSLRSQRFWDHMKYLDAEKLLAVERELTSRIVEKYNLNLGALFYDATNFDTFLSSENPSRLAKRGHAKSKRTDLRIIGLALMVSSDFHVPLFSRIYEGNKADSVTFSEVLDDLVARYQIFRERCRKITLVFDKGNNSEDNIKELDGSPYHFIGSLVPTQHQDLLSIPLEQFRYMPGSRFKGVRVYRTEKEVFGKTRTIVITRSQPLLRGQVRGIHQHLTKKIAALQLLQKKLETSYQPGWSGKPYTREGLEKAAAQIVSGQYVNEFLWAKVTKRASRLHLKFGKDASSYRSLKRRVLGKRILFTDNAGFTNEEIISGYRGQYHVEQAFKDMKDPYFVGFSPNHHWTDQMIRVHGFYCVMALTLSCLLHRKVDHLGVDLSKTAMLRELQGIKEINNYYPPQSADPLAGGRPRSETTMTKMNPVQEKLFRGLALSKFVKNR